MKLIAAAAAAAALFLPSTLATIALGNQLISWNGGSAFNDS